MQTYQVVGFHEHIREKDFSFPIKNLVEQVKKVQPDASVGKLKMGMRGDDPIT